MGRLLSMSVVTAKVVAPGSEEAKASEPAPIRRRFRSGKLRAQKLLRRAHDHDAFQASQFGAARQSAGSPGGVYKNEPDFTSPARRYFARITPLGDALLSTSSKPA